MTTLAELEARFAALPRGIDVPNTPAAQTEHWELQQTLSKRISVIKAAEAEVAEVRPQLVELTNQRGVLMEIRRKNCDDLLAVAQATDRASAKRIAALKCSIRMIDGRFDLQSDAYPAELPLLEQVRQAGYPPTAANPLVSFFGSLPAIEAQIGHLEKRSAEAEQNVELALRDPVPV